MAGKFFKRVRFRVFHAGNKKFDVKEFKPMHGQYFSSGHVENLLARFVAHLEKNLPSHEFRLVPIVEGASTAAFNFVHAGMKDDPAKENTQHATA